MTAPAPEASTRLPTFTVSPGPLQVFSFAAATWNHHRIHYDTAYTTEHEGYDSILVQGPLLGSWMLELAERWVDTWGEVTEFTYRTVRPVPVGASLEVPGSVVSLEPEARADVWVSLPDGTRVAIGQLLANARPSSVANGNDVDS